MCNILIVPVWLSSPDTPFSRAIGWVLTFSISLIKTLECCIIILFLIFMFSIYVSMYYCLHLLPLFDVIVDQLVSRVVWWISFCRTCPHSTHEMNLTMSFLWFLIQSLWMLVLLIFCCLFYFLFPVKSGYKIRYGTNTPIRKIFKNQGYVNKKYYIFVI